jgi:hypothetical protein
MLARSPIHGVGVFCAHAIPADTDVLALRGKWIRTDRLPLSEESLLHPDRECVWLSHQVDTLSFINHSDTPNCFFLVSSSEDDPHLRVGPAHIRAWSELTVAYGGRYCAES